MNEINPRRIFLYLLISSVVLSAVVGVGVLLFGDWNLVEVRVLMTTLVITIVSVLGLACGAYMEIRNGKHLPLAGIALSVVAGLMSFFIIWDVLDDDEVFIKSFLTVTLLATACAHISLLSLARLDRRFSWTRVSAVACIVLLSSILLFILWLEPTGESDLIYRVLGVLGIVLASITVVTPVLHKLSSTDEADAIVALDREIAEIRGRLEELEAHRARLVSEPNVDKG
jgi:hypothetical protein